MRPHLQLTLYGENWEFLIHVEHCEESSFPELSTFFHNAVRPVTCNIKLTTVRPSEIILIEDDSDYASELWLNGKPLPAGEFNRLLLLAEPTLPSGGIDFDHGQGTWVFRSPSPLSELEKNAVTRATGKAGISTEVHFVVDAASFSGPSRALNLQGDQTLITSRQLNSSDGVLKELVEKDEDEWRVFLSRRANLEIISPEPLPGQFACLYDVEQCGQSRLSELLTIYDRVDIIPGGDANWLNTHQVPLQDLQELVRLNRVRLILPSSTVNYNPEVIKAVAEVDRSAIILSRSLAARTIIRSCALRRTSQPACLPPESLK